MNTPAKKTIKEQVRQGLYDQAEFILNEVGVHKEDFLKGIWNNFLVQTVQLITAGYQKRFIINKLEELAISRAKALKE